MSYSTMASDLEGGDRVGVLYVGDSTASASATTVTVVSQEKKDFASQRSSGKTQ